MSEDKAMVANPQWIAKMYRGKTGRDHLGLGSVSSDQILTTLSPGINVLTIHPRYYSFYAFVLDEFWRRELPRNHRAWVRFYRPREFIYSLGTHLCNKPEHGNMHTVVGSDRTGPLATKRLDKYDTTFNYIESDLGGYGLYYRTSMAQLGLLLLNRPGLPIDIPTEKGKEVAHAFRQVVQNTDYYRDYFNDDATQVPIDVISEYISKACLCQLQLVNVYDRPVLINSFLYGEAEENSGAAAEARRITFRLFLDIASQTRGHALDEHTFRQLLYFGEAQNGATYNPEVALLDIYRCWRLYQAREYYAFALNAIWYHLCDWGIQQGGAIYPVPLTKLWQYLSNALDINQLATFFNIPEPQMTANSDFQKLLEWLQTLVCSDERTFDRSCTLSASVQEHQLYQLAMNKQQKPEIKLAGMLTMLALIFLRFRSPELSYRPEWIISLKGAGSRLSVDGFINQLHRKLQNGPIPIIEIARWILTDYIIMQHQLIASTKWPDNTFRFRQEGDKLRFYPHSNTLGFNDSRFNALSTILHELGLCGNFNAPEHSLTAEGERLLAKGDLK